MFNVTKPDDRGLENVVIVYFTNANPKNYFNSIAANTTRDVETLRTPTKTITNSHSGNSNSGLIGI